MDASHWIILLVAIPMGAAILTTLLRDWLNAQRIVTLLALLSCFAISIGCLINLGPDQMLVSQAGDWPAPFGISIVFDQLSGLLIAAAAFVALCVYIYGLTSNEHEVGRGWYHPLFALLMMGVNFSFLTGDLFNLFVAFEIMLMASYALMALGGSARQLSQCYKYVMLNLVGSTIFVLGAALIYGMTGTLNYADLAVRVAEASIAGGEPLPPGFAAVVTMLLFVFAVKSALFPLWFWLPDTYHTCTISVAALFSGLLTKVGIYAMIRLAPMVFAAPELREAGPIMIILPVAAGLTMLLGGVAALAMREIRRVFAMLLISHIGYMAFGLAVMTPASLSGAVYYAVQHMLVMAALFLSCGLIERYQKSSDIAETGGLQKLAPWLSVAFFVLTLSLIGLPPFPGFFGKFLLLSEGFRLSGDGYWLLSVLALITSLFTLLALAKIWGRTFWGPDRSDVVAKRIITTGERYAMAPMYVGLFMLVAGAVTLGVAAEPVQRRSALATQELDAPRNYVRTILGPGVWPEPNLASEETPLEPSITHAFGGDH